MNRYGTNKCVNIYEVLRPAVCSRFQRQWERCVLVRIGALVVLRENIVFAKYDDTNKCYGPE